MDRHEEALDSFSSSLVVRPTYAPALLNHGVSLYHLGRLQQSAGKYRACAGTGPAQREGTLQPRQYPRMSLRRFDESPATFAQTLALAPDHAEAQWKRRTRLLLAGLGARLAAIEWRWKPRASGTSVATSRSRFGLCGEGITVTVHHPFGLAAAFLAEVASFQPRHPSLPHKASPIRTTCRRRGPQA